MAKYLIKHWVNADFMVEKVVDESEIDTVKNDLKQYKTPDSSFSFVMIKGSEKINRSTYEKYDESLNNSSKERTSDK
jgi:hypothetical protein|tara:strand:+ start:3617 stop:3847 length:231 start_codon:yes stop_codon:yes gene_type:complete